MIMKHEARVSIELTNIKEIAAFLRILEAAKGPITGYAYTLSCQIQEKLESLPASKKKKRLNK